MSKAVAVHAIVLVIVIAMFTIFALIAFSGYLGIQSTEVGRAACAVKLTNFCSEWLMKDTTYASDKKPDWWSTKEPTNCDQFDITEPTPEQCGKQK